MSRIASLVAVLAVASSVFAFGACSASPGTDSQTLVGAEETNAGSQGVSGAIAVGTTLIATADVNLRTGPSTSKSILHVVPDGSSVTVVASTPQNGFYNVKHNGVTGWSYGAYYTLGSPPPTTTTGAGGGSSSSGAGGATSTGSGTTTSTGSGNPSDDITSNDRGGALLRAQASVGFSYWWGHGRFLDNGPSSSNKGSCSGSCPSCSHSGQYGGDCSGMVAKAWMVPSSNDDLTVDDHPYATSDFVSDTSQWKTVDRGSLIAADALVYHSGGDGHVFIYNSGDGWGSIDAYECKGCSYGCVHDVRTASSAYHGIRRSGY